MFNFFKKSPERAAKERFYLWHKACVMLIPDENEMGTPRGIMGAASFFIGGIDAICQAHKVSEKKWLELTGELIKNIGLPVAVSMPIVKNYYLEEKSIPLVDEAIKAGGKCASDFLSGRNTMAPLSFSMFIKECSVKPDLSSEEAMYLL